MAVFTDSAPVAPVAVHTGFVPAPSQPERQKVSFESLGIGKLCETPVQPLSRSLPSGLIVTTRVSGPPAGFAPQVVGPGPPPPVQLGFGWQVSRSMSLSRFGFAGETACRPIFCVRGFFTAPFFFTLSGTSTSTKAPHAELSSGGTGRAAPGPRRGSFTRVRADGGKGGTHVGRLSFWLRQTATPNRHESLHWPSRSQAGSPSMQTTSRVETAAGTSTAKRA